MIAHVIDRSHLVRPETILFVGAGATQRLCMPTTNDQAGILWTLCDVDELTAKRVEASAKGSHCFDGIGQKIVDLLRIVDPGEDGSAEPCVDSDIRQRAFPGIGDGQVRVVIADLRRHYDWSALKLVAKVKKGDGWGSEKVWPRENYLQEVFTLIDACLRESRGFAVFLDGKREPIMLSVDRLRAARKLLILLTNTMFACAWQRLIGKDGDKAGLVKYRAFFRSLAHVMQKEGVRFDSDATPLDSASFYKFSYSLITTNFEPIFLWLVWQGHLQANKGNDVRVGNPGRKLNLLMNFPTTVGMRKPADSGEELENQVWLPCTEAVAQNVNKEKYADERAFRLGMYAAVHGMSSFRHCPVCGRLNLYIGDSWDEDSATLFPNGITAELRTGQQARTKREEDAHKRGEYDALECHFCGALTHAFDNFMFMQTQLKCAAPSFIKEMTDDALSQISGAKHIVLLGYSMPLDDAIWGSLLTTMSRRPKGEKLYCSVAATYDENGPDGWFHGKELEEYVARYDNSRDEFEKVRAIKNAITVFGLDNVRAFVKGIPAVFGDCTEFDVRKLMYPTNEETGWNIPGFQDCGVVRKKWSPV